MIEAAGFAMLRPWWLAALPLFAFAGYFYARQPAGLAMWERAIDAPLMAALRRAGAAVPGPAERRWLPAAIAGLVALALSGPATRTGDLGAFRNIDGLVIAVDLSRSVTEGGNFAAARDAARLAAQGAGSRPVALVAYGADAYEAQSFTIDARALGTTIALLDAETVPGAGSNPARALGLSRQLLAESKTVLGDVLIVTDGGGITDTAIEEAHALAAAGARLSALFIPASAGDTPPADPAALQSLVNAGNGTFATLDNPGAILSLTGTPLSTRLAATDYTVLAWEDHGRILLVFALALIVPLFRRRA